MDHPVCVAALPGCEVTGTIAVADEAAARAAGAGLLLCRYQDALSLQVLDSDWKPVSLSFAAGRLGFRLAHDRVRHERLVKALGGVPAVDKPVHVCDATAGLGRDALIMAQAGFRVRMLERNPVLHALLADALDRLQQQDPELSARLTLSLGEAVAQLEGLAAVDHVYLDPMFPARGKAAAVKKDLQVLQRLLAGVEGSDEASLLQAARLRAAKSVVVKRPVRAAPLAGTAPSHSVPGKAVRFDVYRR